MKCRFLLIFILTALSQVAFAQVQAKAISYKLTVDLTRFDKDAAAELNEKVLLFESDVYYTEDKVRSIYRVVKTPDDYQLSFRQRLYNQLSVDQYDIEYDNKYMVMKEGHAYKPKSTGKTKKILNYVCKEYTLTDFRGIAISFWVTDKLGKNVCPWGNFSLKGTALEIVASNGVTFTATDFASGELAANFFDVPTDFQVDKIPFPKPAKK